MKKIFLMILFIMLVAKMLLNAQQSIFIEKNDGTTNEISLSIVQKINFSGTNMLLHKNNGETLSWSITDIQKYYYDTSSDIENPKKINPFNVSIYPNPAINNLNIDFKINNKGRVNIYLTDINGKLIKTILSDNKEKGNYSINQKIHEINAGIYLLHIKYNNNKSTKKIIIL